MNNRKIIEAMVLIEATASDVALDAEGALDDIRRISRDALQDVRAPRVSTNQQEAQSGA